MSAGVRMAVSLFAVGVLSLGAAAGCSKPGEDSEAKRSPIPEPAPDVTVPAQWSIPLEIGHSQIRNIDSAELNKHTPDFADDERKAWRLDKLLSESEFPLGSLVEAIGADGVGIAMRRQNSPDAPVPVVVLSRRGDIVAAAVKASDPFPDYHGQGGRLKRPGDPLPRLISPLARLRVSDGDDGKAQEAAPATMKNLRIQIGSSPANEISPSVLAAVPSSKVAGESGATKTIWNVRDLVKASAGDDAVLVSIQGDETLAVSAEQWANLGMRPILQVNRRGNLKFQWQKDDVETEGQVSVHSVRVLKVER